MQETAPLAAKTTAMDTTGFEEELGLRIDPANGMAYRGEIHYENGEPTTIWFPTGYTFERAWVLGPGLYQRFGWMSLASEMTAEAMKNWLTVGLAGMSAVVDITEASWDIFKLVDHDGKHVPQRMLSVKFGDKVTRLNAGLTASNSLRTSPAFALEMVRSQLLGD